MTAVPTQNQLEDLGEATPATMPVAVIRREPSELAERKSLKFREGFDDLDYVAFSTLSLPFGSQLALVRHKNSPSPGTEVWVVPDEPSVAEALVETIRVLNLSIEDLSWIHPQYESELKHAIASSSDESRIVYSNIGKRGKRLRIIVSEDKFDSRVSHAVIVNYDQLSQKLEAISRLDSKIFKHKNC